MLFRNGIGTSFLLHHDKRWSLCFLVFAKFLETSQIIQDHPTFCGRGEAGGDGRPGVDGWFRVCHCLFGLVLYCVS